MATFNIIVTRDITESCYVLIEAASKEEAEELALDRACEDTDLVWEQDDNHPSHPYVTNMEVWA